MSDLIEAAKKCALYDFDSVEMVECKWAAWQDIINALIEGEKLHFQLVRKNEVLRAFVYAYERQDADNFNDDLRMAYAVAEVALSDEEGK